MFVSFNSTTKYLQNKAYVPKKKKKKPLVLCHSKHFSNHMMIKFTGVGIGLISFTKNPKSNTNIYFAYLNPLLLLPTHAKKKTTNKYSMYECYIFSSKLKTRHMQRVEKSHNPEHSRTLCDTQDSEYSA